MIDDTIARMNSIPANTLERCPVCSGKGLVRSDFYDVITIESTSPTLLKTIKCRSCEGKGYIQIRQPQPEYPYQPVLPYWPYPPAEPTIPQYPYYPYWYRTWTSNKTEIKPEY